MTQQVTREPEAAAGAIHALLPSAGMSPDVLGREKGAQYMHCCLARVVSPDVLGREEVGHQGHRHSQVD